MKNFCFTVDDNIRFLHDLNEKRYASIFENEYLSVYKRLHDDFGAKIQLNLFFRAQDFRLDDMTDCYKAEFAQCSDWLKLSFHSAEETVSPYINSSYDEVFYDCRRVHDEIVRFTSIASLAKTTTIHYCNLTADGVKAISDCDITGLLGLYGTEENPRRSYDCTPKACARLRRGEIVKENGVCYKAIDAVINTMSEQENLEAISLLLDRNFISIMIHEQYFYPDYPRYQPDFEQKLRSVFTLLCSSGYESDFFENVIEQYLPAEL